MSLNENASCSSSNNTIIKVEAEVDSNEFDDIYSSQHDETAAASENISNKLTNDNITIKSDNSSQDDEEFASFKDSPNENDDDTDIEHDTDTITTSTTTTTNIIESEFKLIEKDFDESEIDREYEEGEVRLRKQSTESLILKLREHQLSNDTVDPADTEQIDEALPLELDDEWRSKSKHIFVLSEAGKPIFSLHGNEVELITFMGLIQALVSIVECENENKLLYLIAGDHKCVFLHRNHLILVCISNELDICVEHLKNELTYVYDQIVSVTTLSLIEKIFSRQNNYDLRNKLTGTEKLLKNIVERYSMDYGMLLCCMSSFSLQSEVRDQIARIIAQQINPLKHILFGLFFYDNQLVALIRPKSKNMHPIDVHLLVNVITGLDTPKTSEFTWYPICLPYFDNT
jgi:hypothetical protein